MKNVIALLVTLTFCSAASAHTLWLLPSHFVLSKPNSWIAVDASAGNMTFQPDKGIALDNLKLYLPDGKVSDVTDVYKGKRKSMADVQLAGDGTYRLELSNGVRYMTSYELNGERKRLMADKTQRVAQLPDGATKVHTSQMRSRSFAYVTVNSPTEQVLALSGEGLEISSATHPADVVATEPLTLVFNLNGKPQAGVKGVVSFDGELYRNAAARIEFETDNKGQFSFTPATAGRYLIEAEYSTEHATTTADSQRDAINYSFEVALP